MAAVDVLAAGKTGLSNVQELQRAYDAVGWRVSESDSAKLRHIVLHLAKTIGVLASLAEQHDHLAENGEEVGSRVVAGDLRAERGRVADLVAFAAQLAELAQGDLGEFFEQRLLDNARRWAPASEIAGIAREVES